MVLLECFLRKTHGRINNILQNMYKLLSFIQYAIIQFPSVLRPCHKEHCTPLNSLTLHRRTWKMSKKIEQRFWWQLFTLKHHNVLRCKAQPILLIDNITWGNFSCCTFIQGKFTLDFFMLCKLYRIYVNCIGFTNSEE